MTSRRAFCTLAPLLMTPWPGIASPTKPPLRVPFGVQHAGSKVELDLVVSYGGPHLFNLLFPYRENDPEDYRRVRKLAGDHVTDALGVLLPSGVPLSIHLVIEDARATGDTRRYDKVRDPSLAAYGGGYVYKRIDSALLEPGRYRISATSLRRAQELDGLNIQFGVTRDQRAA